MTEHAPSSQSRLRPIVWSAATILWLTPLVAMQFTTEVGWSVMDFVLFGVMLLAACGAFEIAMRSSTNLAYRAGAALAIASGFFMVWSNLAVGIIGDEGNPANLMYFGVLGIGFLGAIHARFEARGLARTLYLMVGALAVIAGIALLGGIGDPITRPAEVLALTGLFMVLFGGAAGLFRNAANDTRHT